MSETQTEQSEDTSTTTEVESTVTSPASKAIAYAAMKAAAAHKHISEDTQDLVEINKENFWDYLTDDEYKSFKQQMLDADKAYRAELEAAGKITVIKVNEDTGKEEAVQVTKASKAPIERFCRTCNAKLPVRTGRGRPPVECDDCKSKSKATKKTEPNICWVCGEVIEPTGKRGRPATAHSACKDQILAWDKAVQEAEKAHATQVALGESWAAEIEAEKLAQAE